MLGTAIRGAQSIGLHLCPRGNFQIPANEKVESDIRKRAWYGCVYFDRYCKLIAGLNVVVFSP